MEVTKSKQRAKSQKAQDAICEAAIQSLFESGYGETSLNKVAAMAGFSKGALQHHFPSKEELIAATVDRLLNRVIHPTFKLSKPSETVEESLLRSWQKMVNTAAYRALMEILNAARADQKLQNRIKTQLHEWGRALDQQSIDHYVAVDGDAEDVRALMTMTRAFMRGLIIQERYIEDPAENEALLKRWIDLISPLLRLRSKLKRTGDDESE